MEKIENCDGYKKLIEAVKRDCKEGTDCFNPDGCKKEPGIKCTHRYCDTFKWVLERVKHYSEKTGIPESEILDAWEKKRDYWYMNYYQDANQPLIKSDRVKVFETKEDLQKSIDGKGFRCPQCKGISKNPYECDSGIVIKDIKDGKKRACNWKSYGLFGTLGNGITVFVKEGIHMEEIFMPVAWEKQEGN